MLGQLPSFLRTAWLTALIFAVGCQQSSTQPQDTSDTKDLDVPRSIPVVTAQLRQWPKVARIQGSLFGDENAVVGTKVSGSVRMIGAEVGDSVKQGQVLAELDLEDFELNVRHDEAQVAQAAAALGMKPGDSIENLNRNNVPLVRQEQAVLNEARSKLERAKLLYSRRAVSIEELQQIEAVLNVAEARFQSALTSVEEKIATYHLNRAKLAISRQAQADAVIRAPFDAKIQQRHVAPGVYVDVGDPVFTLVRTSPLRFRAGVPERDAAGVEIGKTVRFRVEGISELVEAKISRVSPAVDVASRTLMIEADIKNEDGKLRPGLFAEGVVILDPDSKVVAVPQQSITHFAGLEKVWIVVDGMAAERPVKTGRRDDGWVEIVEGIDPGSVVIADASQGRVGPVKLEDTVSSTTELSSTFKKPTNSAPGS